MEHPYNSNILNLKKSKKMKSELELTLTSKVKYLKNRIEANQKKLNEDYCYYFSWVGEELFVDTFMVKHYELILKSDNISNEISRMINSLIVYTMQSYNVRENSTGALHREASTFKFIASMELQKELVSIIKNN